MGGNPSADEMAALPLFAGLTREEHERLATIAEVVEYATGSAVFEEGSASTELFIMLDGRVTLCMRVPGKPETCFLTLRSGEILGWSALLLRPRVATARVVRPSRLLRLRVSDVLELCETDHHVGYAIMRQAFEEMADRLYATRLQLLDMFGEPGS